MVRSAAAPGEYEAAYRAQIAVCAPSSVLAQPCAGPFFPSRGQIGSILRYDRPDDWPLQYEKLQEAMTVDQVREAAQALRPGQLTWVEVGDLSKIEQPLRKHFGEQVPVQVLDADGQKVE
jgi:hypothetical protein